MSIDFDILDLKSYKAINDILIDCELKDFQCVDIIKALYFKRFILRHDTGMGKTLLASAIMKMLINEDKQRKFIMIVKKSQLSQTPAKIRKYTNLKILTATAESKSIERLLVANLNDYNIIMITHQCLNDINVMYTLLKFKKQFCGVIIDEAHELTNYEDASSAFMLYSMMNSLEYCYALTATPITTSISQLARLMHMTNRELFPDVRKLNNSLEARGICIPYSDRLIASRTREDLGIFSEYKPHAIITKPHPYQLEPFDGPLFLKTKGYGAVNQVTKLIELINSRRPGRGIIYIHHHEVRLWVLSKLKETDIKFDCIHGKTPMRKRKDIMDNFNSGGLDIIITSVTTSVDLDADYVIFYEFTVEIMQIIGRAHRGLNPKSLEIFYIFVEGVKEIEYFRDNIYERSLDVKFVLGIDFMAIIDTARQLMQCNYM